MTTLLVKKTYLRINVKSVKLVDEIKLLLSDLHCSAEDQCEETSGVNGDHLHFNYLNILLCLNNMFSTQFGGKSTQNYFYRDLQM